MVDFAALEESLLLLPSYEVLGLEEGMLPASIFSNCRDARAVSDVGLAATIGIAASQQSAASKIGIISNEQALLDRGQNQGHTPLDRDTDESKAEADVPMPVLGGDKLSQGVLPGRQKAPELKSLEPGADPDELDFDKLLLSDNAAVTKFSSSDSMPSKDLRSSKVSNPTNLDPMKKDVEDLESWLDSL